LPWPSAVPRFGNWSQKAGVWHCEPPTDFLNDMVFVRLHLDATDADTGPMEIALGSHKAGAVPAGQAQIIADLYPTELCIAARGDILVLHMLILHRSRSALAATQRRTLRVDYAAAPLPPSLEWADG
jgi:hypothetical protein